MFSPFRKNLIVAPLLLAMGAALLSGCADDSAPSASKSTPSAASTESTHAAAAYKLPTEKFPKSLAAFGMFEGSGATQEPALGVVPYDINTPLFSDYTSKYRFIRLPAGTTAAYHETSVLEFPVGTIIAKTFTYPHDMRDPSKGERLLETRILWHDGDGWRALPYVWNEARTEATLAVAGTTLAASWIDEQGEPRTNDYIVPNVNQCKGCHLESGKMGPIGPKIRQLNRLFAYHGGAEENQIEHWRTAGILTGGPTPDAAPKLPVWNDPSTGSLDARARAWLEINCSHCHNPAGPARNAGLDLLATHNDPYRYGVFKTPAAAGRGTGGNKYDIVPGQPDQSILAYRIASTQADVAMPELGNRLIHAEGVALVREWIASMEVAATPENPTPPPTTN